jgi:hypothetical protein
MDSGENSTITRLEEVMRGNLRPANLLNGNELAIPETAIPELIAFLRLSLGERAAFSRTSVENHPTDPDAGARLSAIASEFVAAGYMASPRSLDRLKAHFEDTLLWFACDEMTRMLATREAQASKGFSEKSAND